MHFRQEGCTICKKLILSSKSFSDSVETFKDFCSLKENIVIIIFFHFSIIYLIKNIIYINGADINEATKYGETALFNACKNGNEVVVKYLVEHGADVNKETRNGKTPLFEAC